MFHLTGDYGARGLTDKYREQTAFIEWYDEVSLFDIDAREDYEKSRRSFSDVIKYQFPPLRRRIRIRPDPRAGSGPD